jgi:hypothetical protein
MSCQFDRTKLYPLGAIKMKSRIIPLALAVVFFHALEAHAVLRPGWERPILRADLTEFDDAGHEQTPDLKKELFMNKRDGANNPTSFTFIEEHQVVCVTAPCPPVKVKHQFAILSQKIDRCGSAWYTTGLASPVSLAAPQTLQLVDHRNRSCRDYKKHLWEATITTKSLNRVYERQFSGNPEDVYTIQ